MKPIFATIASLFGYTPKPASLREPLLGLTPEQARSLAALRDSPAWEHYLSTLDTVVNLYAEALLQTRDASALHETRGVILGLRKAASLVDETLHRADELTRQQHQSAQLADDQRQRRHLSLYGSPAWDGGANHPA